MGGAAALGGVAVVACAVPAPRHTAQTLGRAPQPVAASVPTASLPSPTVANGAARDVGPAVGAAGATGQPAAAYPVGQSVQADTAWVDGAVAQADHIAERADEAAARADRAARALDDQSRLLDRMLRDLDGVGRRQERATWWDSAAAVADSAARLHRALLGRYEAAAAAQRPALRAAAVQHDTAQARLLAQFYAVVARARTMAEAALDRDARQRARADTVLRALQRQLRTLEWARPTPGSPTDDVHRRDSLDALRVSAPSNAELRALVGRHAPRALTGALGHRPFVWLLLSHDGGAVRETATGVAGMLVAPDNYAVRGVIGRPATDADADAVEPRDSAFVFNAEGVWRKFPSLRERQLLRFGWTNLPAGADTVQVIWAVPARPRSPNSPR